MTWYERRAHWGWMLLVLPVLGSAIVDGYRHQQATSDDGMRQGFGKNQHSGNDQNYVVAVMREHLSESQRQTQFERAEKALAELVVSNGELQLSPATVAVLDRAVSAYVTMTEVPADSTSDRLNRIRFLVEKSVPVEISIEVGELFVRYVGLKRAEQALQRDYRQHQPANPWKAVQKERIFYRRLAALRQQHLGLEVSQALFSEQDAMALYLISRREIMVNPNLSSSEKQQQIQQIQLAFQTQTQTQAQGQAHVVSRELSK